MDIIARAENTINNLARGGRNNEIGLTTSQLRKFLSAVNILSNRVELFKITEAESEQLSPELIAEVKYLKVKLVYQAGREKSVKDFMKKAELLSVIDGIGDSIAKYEEFAKYMEALVAYRKFAGGDK